MPDRPGRAAARDPLLQAVETLTVEDTDLACAALMAVLHEVSWWPKSAGHRVGSVRKVIADALGVEEGSSS